MIDSFERGEYRFLSNFYRANVVFEDVVYPTAEHAYQAAKTIIPAQREIILHCSTPGAAKREGRLVTLREDWDQIKLDVMKKILESKFQDASLRTRLKQTITEELVEGNDWHDNFWGICSPCALCTSQGKVGENMLGQLLMDLRAHL
jgi:ribA/ribD-fused uncharacterized protein